MRNIDNYYKNYCVDKTSDTSSINKNGHKSKSTEEESYQKTLKRTYDKFVKSYFRNLKRKSKKKEENEDEEEQSEDDWDNERSQCSPTPLSEVEDTFCLSPNIAEDLSRLYQASHPLSDKLLKTCVFNTPGLKVLHIKDAHDIKPESLEKMKKYRLRSLEISNMPNCSLNRTVSLLSTWSINNLTDLTISKCRFSETNWICISVSLGKLRQLKVLNVSYTNISNDHLELACEELSLIESLNISNTLITRIKPLNKLRYLRRLTMNNMEENIEDMRMLVNMRKLTHLSLVEDKYQGSSLLQEDKLVPIFYDLLEFPYLIDLDVSGRRKIDLTYIDDLFQGRELRASLCKDYKELKFCGINCTGCNSSDIFYLTNVLMCETQLHGMGTLKEVCLALERDQSHGRIAHETVKYLYNLLSERMNTLNDRISFELPVIGNRLLHALIVAYRHQFNSSDFGITTTAVMHRILVAESERGFYLLPTVFHEMFELLLDSLEHHPSNLVLTLNTLLILYREGTKDNFTFNYARCLKLLLATLSTYEMIQVQSIIFPFSEFLRNKLTFKQMKHISACLCHVQALLKIVKDYIRSPPEKRISHCYIKVVLLMLWDFSDESPNVCGSFVLSGGIEVYLRLLQVSLTYHFTFYTKFNHTFL